MKFFSIIYFLISHAVFVLASPEAPRIWVIAPIAHPAMTAIEAGFKEQLASEYPSARVEFKQGLGDNALLQAIFRQAEQTRVELLAPIGTGTTHMALSLAPTRPILALAANPDSAAVKMNDQRLAIIEDEVEPAKCLQLIHAILPEVTKLTVLYNPQNEKITPQLHALQLAAEPLNLKIELRAITTTQELYLLSKQLPADTQALFILKDHLLVSAVPMIVQMVQARSIPLVACDEGSVASGAAFALGVREGDIGRAGGHVAAEYFRGKSLGSMPVTFIRDLCVFYNTAALPLQKVQLAQLEKATQAHAYTLVSLSP